MTYIATTRIANDATGEVWKSGDTVEGLPEKSVKILVASGALIERKIKKSVSKQTEVTENK